MQRIAIPIFILFLVSTLVFAQSKCGSILSEDHKSDYSKQRIIDNIVGHNKIVKYDLLGRPFWEILSRFGFKEGEFTMEPIAFENIFKKDCNGKIKGMLAIGVSFTKKDKTLELVLYFDPSLSVTLQDIEQCKRDIFLYYCIGIEYIDYVHRKYEFIGEMPKVILTDEKGVSTATASFDPKSDFNDSDYWQNKKKSKNSPATHSP